jgi:hypothetical protein
MQHSAVVPVAGKGQVEGHRHADTAKGMCVRMDLAVEVGAEGAKLVGIPKGVADMGFWMLEVAGPGRSEQSGNYQDLLVGGHMPAWLPVLELRRAPLIWGGTRGLRATLTPIVIPVGCSIIRTATVRRVCICVSCTL